MTELPRVGGRYCEVVQDEPHSWSIIHVGKGGTYVLKKTGEWCPSWDGLESWPTREDCIAHIHACARREQGGEVECPAADGPQWFTKKPIKIQAMRSTKENRDAVISWVGRQNLGTLADPACLWIYTLEGVMRADLGDWIICGVKGEFYPCKPDIFEASYDQSLSPPPPAEPERPGEVGWYECRYEGRWTVARYWDGTFLRDERGNERAYVYSLHQHTDFIGPLSPPHEVAELRLANEGLLTANRVLRGQLGTADKLMKEQLAEVAELRRKLEGMCGLRDDLVNALATTQSDLKASSRERNEALAIMRDHCVGVGERGEYCVFCDYSENGEVAHRPTCLLYKPQEAGK